MVSLISLKPNSIHQTIILQSHFRVSISIILAPGKEPCFLVISSRQDFFTLVTFPVNFTLLYTKTVLFLYTLSDCPKIIPFSAAQDHIAYIEYAASIISLLSRALLSCVTTLRSFPSIALRIHYCAQLHT